MSPKTGAFALLFIIVGLPAFLYVCDSSRRVGGGAKGGAGSIEQAFPSEPTPTPLGERRLVFPGDREIGMVRTRDWGLMTNLERTHGLTRGGAEVWMLLAPARGELVGPAGKEIQLEVKAPYKGNLSLLKALAPDALDELRIRSQIRNADLANLSGLTGLRSLDLALTKTDDTGMPHLINLPALQVLNLKRTYVTDAGLHYLKELKDLRVLNLSGLNITNRGARVLEGMTSLRYLDIRGTRVTQTGRERLQKALRDCRILHNPSQIPPMPRSTSEGRPVS